MPRRRYSRSFKGRTSRSFRSRKGTKARMVASIARREFRVQSARTQEHKLFDAALSSNIGTTGTLAYLGSVAQGNDINQRTGRTLRIESIQFRYDCAINAAATSEGLRVMLIYCINPQAFTSFVVGDFLSGTPSVNSPLNVVAHVGQMICMYDRLHRFSITGEQRQFGKFFKKFNHKMRYFGPNATDHQMGQFVLLLISDNNVQQPGIELYSRIRFRDEA